MFQVILLLVWLEIIRLIMLVGVLDPFKLHPDNAHQIVKNVNPSLNALNVIMVILYLNLEFVPLVNLFINIELMTLTVKTLMMKHYVYKLCLF